jgi:phage RecT family recombinase
MSNSLAEVRALLATTDLKQLMPKSAEGLTPDRFIEQIEYQFKHAKNARDLMACSPASIFSAIKFCAQLGLEPGYGQGSPDVYLIPYNKELKAQTSYLGELKLAMRASGAKKVFAKVVYKADEFEEWADETGEHFKHKINSTGDRTDADVALVYAVAIMADGISIKSMSKAQVDSLEKKTRKGGSMTPAWRDWWQSMALKTVLRSLVKTLPRSNEQVLSETADYENNAIDVVAKPVITTPEQLIQAREIFTAAEHQMGPVNAIFDHFKVGAEDREALSKWMVESKTVYDKRSIAKAVEDYISDDGSEPIAEEP